MTGDTGASVWATPVARSLLPTTDEVTGRRIICVRFGSPGSSSITSARPFQDHDAWWDGPGLTR